MIVVEKEASFKTLLQSGMRDCVFITGKGFPDYATRECLELILNEMSLSENDPLIDMDLFSKDSNQSQFVTKSCNEEELDDFWQESIEEDLFDDITGMNYPETIQDYAIQDLHSDFHLEFIKSDIESLDAFEPYLVPIEGSTTLTLKKR